MTLRGILAAFEAFAVAVLTLGFFVWSGYIAGLGWLMAERRCDESCNDSLGPLAEGLDWTYFRESWQWTAVGLLALVVLCGGVAFVAAIAKGRPALAWAAFAVHFVAVLGFLSIRATPYSTLDAEPHVAAVLVSEVGGLIAIQLRAAGAAILPSKIGGLGRST